MIKEHKKELIIVGLMLLLIIALIGVSYAAFSYSKIGTKVNTITTGSITMSYEETDNTININGALPTTDETGKVRLKEGEYFDFTVSSEIVGDVNINYEISAKDITSSDANKIDGSNIKLYLTRLTDGGTEEELMTPETYNEEASSNSYTGRPSGEMSLYTSSMNASESNRYRLRMWVDEDYNPQGDGGNLEFSVQINVYGLDGLSMEDRMMMAYDSSNPGDFHTNEYKSKITSIVTKGDTIIPEGVIESWDISEKQNGSVIAYVEDDGTGSGTYKVTIGGEDKIIANYDMSLYFRQFTILKTLDLSYLDTSLVTDMCQMFFRNSSLIDLNLSSLDTSNVIDMSQMFNGCESLLSLDLSNFNTSNVTDMGQMFSKYLLGNDMKLKEIIFGENFNTSNVTNMFEMFTGCASLIELDVSNFDTSKVTNMLDMFLGCESLLRLDLRNFNTSKVTSYSQMFKYTTNITEILVTRDTWTIPNSTIEKSGVTDFTYV